MNFFIHTFLTCILVGVFTFLQENEDESVIEALSYFFDNYGENRWHAPYRWWAR